MDSNKLVPIEFEKQRVLLTSQLAESYETEPQVITNNFNRNKEHYKEGRDYYCLEGDDFKQFKATTQIDLPPNINKLYLWTEHGSLRHAKSLGTDKAWEVYDLLEDTYFRAKEISTNISELSPELRLLINIEVKQKQQDKAIAENSQRLDNISDIVALDTRSWRKDAHRLIVRIAEKMGGYENMQNIQAEIYRLIDLRGGKSLARRLTYKRQRMAEEGIAKSKRDKLSYVDVISEDKVLIELYIAIVKEMAIKYGVEFENKKSA